MIENLATPPAGTALPAIVASAGDNYRKATAQTSTVSRALALSAIAVVWLFAGGLGGHDTSPQDTLAQIRSASALPWALSLALLSLALDLAQYAVAAALWGGYRWAIDVIVVLDNGVKQPRGFRRAWRTAKRRGFADEIQTVLDRDMPRRWKDRRLELRQALHPKPPLSQNPHIATLLAMPSSPPSILRQILLLFMLKVLALLGSYASLAIFLLNTKTGSHT